MSPFLQAAAIEIISNTVYKYAHRFYSLDQSPTSSQQPCNIKQIVYYHTKSLQIVMVPSRICRYGLKVAITAAFMFSITFLLPSVGAVNSGHSESPLQQSKMVLGSKPPGCVNKCLSCRPCMAKLVIPSHQWKKFRATYHGDEDDRYYLLSWKCKCGDKFFQP